ncbi:MAG: diguanylate cyclase [Sulfuritalea sp.]|nr:diguanylate cyclase [Sulfuritalea sp.]
MSIRIKILLLGLLAVASLSYILGVRIVSEGREHAAKLEFLTRLEAAAELSSLVHELQKERGISAGYLVIRSPGNTRLLDSQRASTDRAMVQFRNPETPGLESLARLADTRQKISGAAMDPALSFSYYTQTIVEILDQIDALARDSNTTLLTRDLNAHVHLLYAKEYLGQIRASINEALSLGAVDKEQLTVVLRLLNLHQFYIRTGLRDASPEVAQALRGVLGQAQVQHSFALIEGVLSGSGQAPPADQWFAAATHAIDQFLSVEGQSMRYLRQQAENEIAASERRVLLDAGLALAAALALIFFAASAVLSLLRALDVLITNIEHTVATQDFANRIQVPNDDEMGELSHSFNELMSIAEHLIKEKDYFASTDLLTGAYNRYRFTELFGIELQRVQRYGGDLALIMFDIDHFKDINDRFGHAAGDMVLKEIAHLVRNLIRANDVLVRWGGEEFMILVPHTGNEAADLAEKLCLAVEEHHFHYAPRVTASFGVSAHVSGDTLETLCARTDEALYRAKHQGRNRVRAVFAAEPDAGPGAASVAPA